MPDSSCAISSASSSSVSRSRYVWRVDPEGHPIAKNLILMALDIDGHCGPQRPPAEAVFGAAHEPGIARRRCGSVGGLRFLVLGLYLESNRSSVAFKCLATRIPAPIAITRLRPSSIKAHNARFDWRRRPGSSRAAPVAEEHVDSKKQEL